jgi:hypothetical protein
MSMTTTVEINGHVSTKTHEYLTKRLDGARDLYLLALALGRRDEDSAVFGSLIREARVHFAAVIEECRIAGLDTTAIAAMLGKLSKELTDSVRPEIWTRIEQLAQRHHGERRPA